MARYTLAVDRRFKREGSQDADFISCIAFGRSAEFAEKYFHQGIKIGIEGRVQTGSFTNREGKKVYTTDVVIENQEFLESKKSHDKPKASKPQAIPQGDDGFMDLPDDADLPFL